MRFKKYVSSSAVKSWRLSLAHRAAAIWAAFEVWYRACLEIKVDWKIVYFGSGYVCQQATGSENFTERGRCVLAHGKSLLVFSDSSALQSRLLGCTRARGELRRKYFSTMFRPSVCNPILMSNLFSFVDLARTVTD